MQVWQAEVRRPRKLTRLAYFNDGQQRLMAFWERIRGRKWYALRIDTGDTVAPSDTVACEALRLVRKVS
jgi:hypothetical protein